MYFIVLFLLVGVSFSPILFDTVNQWLAQGFFVQTMIGVAFSYSFFENPKYISRNIPLGLLHGWVLISTALFWYTGMVMNKYAMIMFLPYFNFLCLLLLYQFIVQYLSIKQVEKILDYMRWVVIVTMFMTVLQIFGLSQFFERMIDIHPEIAGKYSSFNNLASGFIGNGTLLSGFLGMTTPLFLRKINRENILCLVFMFILLFFTGTTMGNPAATGFVVMGLILGLFCLRRGVKWFIGFLSCLGVIVLIGIVYSDVGDLRRFIFIGERGKLIKYYFEMFQTRNSELMGYGLGVVKKISGATPFPRYPKLHLEYFQVMFELGIIGLMFVLNLVWNLIRTKSVNDMSFIMKLAVIGFLVSCLINPMAHIWLSSTWVMAFYGFFIILNDEKRRTM